MNLAKTTVGQQVLRDRSVHLTPPQRAVFILVNGARTIDELLAATESSGVQRGDIDRLVALGLVVAQNPPPAAVRAREPSERTADQERYREAYPIAVKLAADLGLWGASLSRMTEAATNYRELVAVSRRIREAVGARRFAPLHAALLGARKAE